MTPPSPSARTTAEMDRRGWAWSRCEHFQYMGDPADKGRREALAWVAGLLMNADRVSDKAKDGARPLLHMRSQILAASPPVRLDAEGKPQPPGIRRDLFGFADFIALDGRPGSLLLQVTTGGEVARRLEKIRRIPAARTWLLAGNRIEVWGWREVADDEPQGLLVRGARKPKRIWLPRILPVTLEMLGEVKSA